MLLRCSNLQPSDVACTEPLVEHAASMTAARLVFDFLHKIHITFLRVSLLETLAMHK